MGSNSDFISMSDGRSSSESSESHSPGMVFSMPSPSSNNEAGPSGTAYADNSSECSWETDTKRKYLPKIKVHSLSKDDKGKEQIRKRGVRCMDCPACLRKEDCRKCEMCRDKKKFGGPGIKKQACM